MKNLSTSSFFLLAKSLPPGALLPSAFSGCAVGENQRGACPTPQHQQGCYGLEIGGVQNAGRPCQSAVGQCLSPNQCWFPQRGLEQDQVRPDAGVWYNYYWHVSCSLFPYKDRNTRVIYSCYWPFFDVCYIVMNLNIEPPGNHTHRKLLTAP